MALFDAVLGFVIAAIVSTVIIYIVTRLFGEKEGVGTAIIAALIGSVIYGLSYYFLGAGLLSAIIGGVAWLIALAELYNMGWGKSLVVAVVIWIIALAVGFVLPTAPGPL